MDGDLVHFPTGRERQRRGEGEIERKKEYTKEKKNTPLGQIEESQRSCQCHLHSELMDLKSALPPKL